MELMINIMEIVVVVLESHLIHHGMLVTTDGFSQDQRLINMSQDLEWNTDLIC